MNPTDRLTYELLKLRNDAEIARLRRRAAWQEWIYLLAGVVIVLVLGWSMLASH